MKLRLRTVLKVASGQYIHPGVYEGAEIPAALKSEYDLGNPAVVEVAVPAQARVAVAAGNVVRDKLKAGVAEAPAAEAPAAEAPAADAESVVKPKTKSRSKTKQPAVEAK